MKASHPLRIVLTGSECTGKSSLTRTLAAHYGVDYAPEYLRHYFEQAGGKLSIEDAIPIAKGQLRQEQVLEKQGTNPIFCDTNLLSSIIYTNHYYGSCPQWIEDTLQKRPYDHYFLCHIDVPWQADGQRDLPEERDQMQARFEAELIRRQLPYTPLQGSQEKRLAKAINVVDALLCTK